MNLHNETLVNVAALLQEPVGSTRHYRVALDEIVLDDEVSAKVIDGEIQLTRLSNEILAQVRAEFVIDLECQRCLEPFEQSQEIDFTESFLVSVDVRTGVESEVDSIDEEMPEVTAAHEIDLAESLRQEMLISMPMRPICKPDCEGLASEIGQEDEGIDSRFASLSQLLQE